MNLVSNISMKKDWDEVEELIYDATETPEFVAKYGKTYTTIGIAAAAPLKFSKA